MAGLQRNMILLFLFGCCLATFGCRSPQEKARETLEKYELVFQNCRQRHLRLKLTAGRHRCCRIASMALEMSLSDSGLPESKWRPMLKKWLAAGQFSAYFIGKRSKR